VTQEYEIAVDLFISIIIVLKDMKNSVFIPTELLALVPLYTRPSLHLLVQNL